MRLLLEAGADTDAKDYNGKTALKYARENGHTSIVALLENSPTTADARQPLVRPPARLAPSLSARPAPAQTGGRASAAPSPAPAATANGFGDSSSAPSPAKTAIWLDELRLGARSRAGCSAARR